MGDRIAHLKWRIAYLLNTRRQCWSDLVSWVLDEEPVRDTGLRAALPWRPITDMCRKDARENGRCYCGKLAADGTVLRRGETVPTPEPAVVVQCPACTGVIPRNVSRACPLNADGGHRCRLDSRHVHEREHRPDGVGVGDHHCACGHVWSTAPAIEVRMSELAQWSARLNPDSQPAAGGSDA